MPRMFMALRQEDRHPITEILRQTPEIPTNCQWGLFLRNHDELTLEMVTDEERDYMYQAYAADPQMRINVGIRRRLAPLMENSRRRIQLLNSLLFSFPGTPVIYYGDELGMGDNIYLGDRNGVRTPMQWTSDRNAGFSRADPARLFAPPVMDPVYGYQSINVEAQERSPFSLLNWTKRMIGMRRQFKVFGRGSLDFLPSLNRKVLTYVREYQDELVLCIANLSPTVQPVELDLSRFKGMTPTEMTGLTEFPRIGELPYFLTLGPYEFYWFRLQMAPAPITARTAQEIPAAPEAFAAFFMGAAWETVLDGNVRTLIEREALVSFIQRQRWFGGKARTIRAARFVDWGVLRRGAQPIFLTVIEVEYGDGDRARYFVPLGIATGARADEIVRGAAHLGMARISGARKGLIVDAGGEESFAAALLELLDTDGQVRLKRGVVRAHRTPAFAELRGEGPLAPRPLAAEQSNTSIMYGRRLVAKLFRRVEAGPNPDVEIGEQLTTKSSFTRAPRVAAAVEYELSGETAAHISVVQALVPSQADGWSHALGELRRFYDEVETRRAPGRTLLPANRAIEAAARPVPDLVGDLAGAYLENARVLGCRTAELHLALSQDTDSEPFAPRPFSRTDVEELIADAIAQGRRAVTLIQDALDKLPPETAAAARELVERGEPAFRTILETRGSLDMTAACIRIHGDYHLGQVLWSEGDFYILDFEGEPARSIQERRRKQSPLKDVAGMLRSFNYAAYAALFSRTPTGAGFDRLERWARVWQLWVGATFLNAYFETAGQAPFVPRDPVQRGQLLDLFLLDKGLYELCYELNSRPDWVRIPLRGVLELLPA
jgi:maltose alpha-D-glucosyltransferase/alpha-amylase